MSYFIYRVTRLLFTIEHLLLHALKARGSVGVIEWTRDLSERVCSGKHFSTILNWEF